MVAGSFRTPPRRPCVAISTNTHVVVQVDHSVLRVFGTKHCRLVAVVHSVRRLRDAPFVGASSLLGGNVDHALPGVPGAELGPFAALDAVER